MLTPTLKIKRHKIFSNYYNEIQKLYNETILIFNFFGCEILNLNFFNPQNTRRPINIADHVGDRCYNFIITR